MKATYLVRHMELEDVPQVIEIDHMSFPTPWPASTYEFEITSRDTSQLAVAELPQPDSRGIGPLRALWDRLRLVADSRLIVGYAACWLIAGEAHISTIAVHPDFRGQGLGELLLASILQRAVHLGGEYSVLEVRASNLTAQALYRKYEYQVVGRRKGYYRDNSEDALLMEIRPLDSAYQQRMVARVAALSNRVDYVDRFIQQPKPLRRK